MKTITQQEEREALRDLPLLPRVIYHESLKPRVDLSTGLVGGRFGLSYQAVAEDVYVAPAPGIAAVKASRWTIARAIEWLVKRGLVAHVGNARSNRDQRLLILSLPMQTLTHFAQNKAAPKPHLKPHTVSHRENPQKAARHPPRKAALHPLSSIATVAANGGGDGDTTGVVDKLDWQPTYPQSYSQRDRRAILKVASTNKLGAKAVREILDEIEQRAFKGAVQNKTGLFVHIVTKQLKRGTYFGKGAQEYRSNGSPLTEEEARMLNEGGRA